MLKSLIVNNYALINHIEINFNHGFSTITGETGAGKSILLGALSLVVGQRADTSVLKDKSKKCFVEAVFDIEKYNLHHYMKANDIDYDHETIIRREINSNGKSRAFINDTPVNLNILKEVGLKLIDIHSQHQNLILGEHQFQLNIIDAYAKHNTLIEKYKQVFTTYIHTKKELEKLIEKSNQSKADLDYHQFQYNQLEEAKLDECNQESLESELEMLKHAEEIKLVLIETSSTLSGGNENAIIDKLREISSLMSKIIKYHTASEDILKRIESTYIELKDIADEVEHLGERIVHNPEKIEQINVKLDLIYTLQQKHNVSSVKELIQIKNNLEENLSEISDYNHAIETLTKETATYKEELSKLAEKISAKRLKITPEVEKNIVDLLKQLGMPYASFHVQHSNLDEFSENGIDLFRFKFSANKKVEAQEISKVASGGELSRLMLSVKSIISKSIALPSIIFDEIDTGVSGDIADKMGDIMLAMSKNLQVISITHLPQIASKGAYQYVVFKEEQNDTTITNMTLLNEEERLSEIAKMLSGKDITDAALANAKELLASKP